MIPVAQAPEPSDFDRKVRQKGLSAIDELVGRAPRVSHRGPRRKAIAKREADIPADAFPPYWRDALDDMLERYQRLCSYLALYIPHGTGGPSVDHMTPKSREWAQVYEWSNYRLCAALVNAKKNDLPSVVDPFEVKDGWFELEFVGFQVKLGALAPPNRRAQIEATLPLLNLPDCRKAREKYVADYQALHIPLSYLERHAPFVARELRRQGKLLRGDK